MATQSPLPSPLTASLRLLLIAALGATILCCTSGRQGPDIGRLPTITSPDPAAEADLRLARQARDSQDLATAKTRYRAFLVERPADPLTAIVRLELGKILLAADDNHEARLLFSEVARHASAAVASKGRFYSAIADARLGESRAAASVLREAVGRTIDPQDTVLLHLTLADVELALDNYKGAVLALNRLLEDPETPPSGREVGQARLTHLLQQEGAPSQVQDAVDALPSDSPAYRPTLLRAIADAAAANDNSRIRALLDQYQHAGLPLNEELQALALRAAEPTKATRKAVGAILPLSGRARRVGEFALRGLMLAANLPPSGPMDGDAAQLLVRDGGGDPERAVEAVEELVNVHHVAAIIGPLERASAKAAAGRAEQLGVPLIALTPASGVTTQGDFIFQALAPAAAEARSLAHFAQSRGLRRVAILHPDSPFGEGMAALFSEAVSATRGLDVVAVQSYPAGETAFGRQIAPLARNRFDALFLPDSSQRIALLAPALAAAGLWSVPAGARPQGKGRPVQLLIPSAGFNASLATKSGRYLQGAAFCTQFAENSSDPAAQGFADRYRAQFGSDPNAIAAVSHDTYKLVAAAAFGQQALDRDGIAARLSSVQAPEAVALLRGLSSARGPTEPLRILVLDGDVMVDSITP